MGSDVEIVGRALTRLADVLRQRSHHAAAVEAGVSEQQLRLLALLDPEDPAMVGELAEHMHVTPSTMSLNLGRLEASGLVSRARDPHDRRVMNVRLTDAGRDLRDATPLFDAGRAAALLTTLRPEERRRAVEGLALLAEAADRWSNRAHEHAAALGGGPTNDPGRDPKVP